MSWFKDSAGHAKAGRLGGKAQGHRTNPGNFKNDPKRAARAGRKGGRPKGYRPKARKATK